jgi:hypothetical protein
MKELKLDALMVAIVNYVNLDDEMDDTADLQILESELFSAVRTLNTISADGKNGVTREIGGTVTYFIRSNGKEEELPKVAWDALQAIPSMKESTGMHVIPGQVVGVDKFTFEQIALPVKRCESKK